ncbi:hypothetical protein Dimus_023751 [Dionaea muscipula]
MKAKQGAPHERPSEAITLVSQILAMTKCNACPIDSTLIGNKLYERILAEHVEPKRPVPEDEVYSGSVNLFPVVKLTQFKT